MRPPTISETAAQRGTGLQSTCATPDHQEGSHHGAGTADDVALRADHPDALHAEAVVHAAGSLTRARPQPTRALAAAAAAAAAGSASRMRATAWSSCAAETNHASNTDGGSETP